nr:hypothetical protein [Staphylococcus aureus]
MSTLIPKNVTISYVDTFEEEAPIDLDQVQQDLKNIDKEIAEIEQEINAYLKELGVLKDE